MNQKVLPVIVAMFALSSGTAQAGGTLGLDEVLQAVKSNRKLVAEIQNELKANKLKTSDVICSGARFGRHWTFLGGGRAAPYECAIGKRELNIEADVVFFDRRGRRLGDLDKVDPARAARFRESNFRWTWAVPPADKSDKQDEQDKQEK